MARRCQLTGKGPLFGHNVSHSNRKTNRRFEPNLQKVTLYSDGLRCPIPMRVSTRALRSVSRAGGLDAYLLGVADAKLAPEALKLKRRLRKALGGSRSPAGEAPTGSATA
jgi:large subunit ribosomal protein L28